MKKKRLIFCFIFTITLIGCYTKIPTPTEFPVGTAKVIVTEVKLQPTHTQTLPILPEVTPSPTYKPSTSTPRQAEERNTPELQIINPTMTKTAVPQEVMKYQCLQVNDNPFESIDTAGVFVLTDGYDRKVYLMDGQNRTQQLLYDNNNTWPGLVVSPDRRWLAYQWESKTKKTRGDGQLFIVGADGKTYANIPTGDGWDFTWLNNDHLLITPMKWDGIELQPLTLFNPFTAEQQPLDTNFPEIFNDKVYWDFYTSSHVVFNPTLDRAIYPRWVSPNEKFPQIVLWNVNTKKELAQIPVPLGFDHTPQWSPDGTQVAIVSDVFLDRVWGGPIFYKDDVFTITSEGKVQRITFFLDYFPSIYIHEYRWSPNGRYLAFWMSENPSNINKDLQLVVLDTQTGQATNFCDLGNQTNKNVPIWAPDQNQLLLGIDTEIQGIETILIDLDLMEAEIIAKGVFPVGWMATPK